MAKGVKRSVTERKAELQTQLDQVREKIKSEEIKAERLENQIKQLEVEEQADFIELAKKLAEKKGTSLIDLLKPLE